MVAKGLFQPQVPFQASPPEDEPVEVTHSTDSDLAQAVVHVLPCNVYFGWLHVMKPFNAWKFWVDPLGAKALGKWESKDC